MKKLILIISIGLLLTGCATHQGHDGRTYYWIKPLPIENPYNQATAPTATTNYYQVNGRSYTVTSFK
jgi:uncharacterized protein YceK